MVPNPNSLGSWLARAYAVIDGQRGVETFLVAVVVAAAMCALAVWLLGGNPPALIMRVPVASAGPTNAQPKPGNEGTLTVGHGIPSTDPGSWPQFRGADRNNIVHDAAPFARVWPSSGLKVLWKLSLGEGHAGAAIRNGRVYLIDYDHDKQEDAIRCLSLADGQEIWRYSYSVEIKRNHGMSRTVPSVTDKYIVTLGPKCHVHCLDAVTGQLVWKKDLVAECGTTVPDWYAGQCPLIEGDRVILAPGASPLMMAVELSSGKTLWQTPNPNKWGMTHSSIAAMNYKGKRQYIYCTTQGVVAVSGEDGRQLWTKPDWKIAIATVPSPLPIGDDRVFLSGGYTNGSVMVRIEGDEDHIVPHEVFRLPASIFGVEQHTPILYNDHIYGIVATGELACLDLTGIRLWTSGMSHQFGRGPFIVAGDLIFALNDQDGILHMVEANPKKYTELAQAEVLNDIDAWAPIAVAGNKFILRDVTTMVCLELPLAQQGTK